MIFASLYKNQKRSDMHHRGQNLIRDGVILSAVATLFYIFCQWNYKDDPLKFDGKQVSLTGWGDVRFRFALAIAQSFVLIGNFFWSPAPRQIEDKDVYESCNLGFGTLTFFTSQSLYLCLLTQWYSFFAAFTENGVLAHGVNDLELWSAGQSLLLTLLFLKLNWFEPGWQKMSKGREEKFPHFRLLMLFTHTGNLPVSALDFFLVQTRDGIINHGPSVTDMASAIVVYGFAYAALIFSVYDLKGVKVYPFVAEVKTMRARFIFASLVCCAVFVGYTFFNVLKHYL